MQQRITNCSSCGCTCQPPYTHLERKVLVMKAFSKEGFSTDLGNAWWCVLMTQAADGVTAFSRQGTESMSSGTPFLICERALRTRAASLSVHCHRRPHLESLGTFQARCALSSLQIVIAELVAFRSSETFLQVVLQVLRARAHRPGPPPWPHARLETRGCASPENGLPPGRCSQYEEDWLVACWRWIPPYTFDKVYQARRDHEKRRCTTPFPPSQVTSLGVKLLPSTVSSESTACSAADSLGQPPQFPLSRT